MEIINTEKHLPGLSRIIQITVPGIDQDTARELALSELENLYVLSIEKPEILECIPETIIAAIKQTMIKGLSLDPGLKLIYVKTRYLNGKKKLEIQETVNGLIWLAQQCGALRSFKKPVVTYDESGRVDVVTFERNNETLTFGKGFYERLRKYSEKQNKGKANALYTSFNGWIDPEFAKTKAIRHGLKNIGINPLRRVSKPEILTTYDEVVEGEEE